MTLLSDAITARDPALILEDLMVRALAKGLTARGWQKQRLQRVLFEIKADTGATTESTITALAAGGFPDTAVGPWLDLVAAGWFDELRNQPLTAIVQVRLSDDTSQGPYTISNPIAVSQPDAAQPLYYRSQAGSVTVPRSGFVDAIFYAVTMGAAYNVAPGQIVDLATPVPGVVVTSPQIGTTGSIVVSPGADAELDDPFRARLKDKWGLLGRGWMASTIRALVRQALAGISLRMVVLDPGPTPGKADVYLATVAGPITAPQALTAYQYLLSPDRKPVGNYPVGVYPSTTFNQTLTITLYSDGTNPSVAADATARLEAYQETLDLGMMIHVSRLVDVLVDVDSGAIGAVITNLAGVEFLFPGTTDSAQFTPSITVSG